MRGSSSRPWELSLRHDRRPVASVAFFAKISSGLALLVLLCLSWIAMPVARSRDRLLGPMTLLLGTGVWMLVHFLVFQPMDVWWRSLQGGLDHVRHLRYPEGYDVRSLIKRYFKEFRELLASAFTDLLPLHVGMLAGFALLEFVRGRRGTMGSPERILLIVFVLAVGLLTARQAWRGGMGQLRRGAARSLPWPRLGLHAHSMHGIVTFACDLLVILVACRTCAERHFLVLIEEVAALRSAVEKNDEEAAFIHYPGRTCST